MSSARSSDQLESLSRVGIRAIQVEEILSDNPTRESSSFTIDKMRDVSTDRKLIVPVINPTYLSTNKAPRLVYQIFDR